METDRLGAIWSIKRRRSTVRKIASAQGERCLYQVSCSFCLTWLPGASGVCIGLGNIQHNDSTCLFEDNLPPSPCQSASRTGERPLTSGMDTMRDFECYLVSRCSRWLANQCPSVIAKSRFSHIISAIIIFRGVQKPRLFHAIPRSPFIRSRQCSDRCSSNPDDLTCVHITLCNILYPKTPISPLSCQSFRNVLEKQTCKLRHIKHWFLHPTRPG